jgi:hypothetical protein
LSIGPLHVPVEIAVVEHGVIDDIEHRIADALIRYCKGMSLFPCAKASQLIRQAHENTNTAEGMEVAKWVIILTVVLILLAHQPLR